MNYSYNYTTSEPCYFIWLTSNLSPEIAEKVVDYFNKHEDTTVFAMSLSEKEDKQDKIDYWLETFTHYPGAKITETKREAGYKVWLITFPAIPKEL